MKNEGTSRFYVPDSFPAVPDLELTWKLIETAREIWATYSPDWQFWNQMRTVATGLAFLLASSGLLLDLRGLRAAAQVTR